MIRYPFLDLKDTVISQRDEIIAAVTRVIDSGRFIGGDECAAFEKALSRYASPHCVGVSNGLDALRLIFRALIELGRLGVGDKVIIPANTFIASVLAVTDVGLTPVLVEPDPLTMNLDLTAVDAALDADPAIRAVMPVHLYGRAAGTAAWADRMRRRGIIVVEDNAQALGATTADQQYTGSLGDASAFSFYPTKNIGALGDAGAVSTPDADLATMVRILANYGSDFRYHNIVCGYNCRLDPIQAAILNVKLTGLAAETQRRRTLADIYSQNIKNEYITLPSPDPGAVWHQYVIRTADRDSLTRYLDDNGVGWGIHYAIPPHRQPCYAASLGHRHLPITDSLAAGILSLPVGQTTTADDALQIAQILNSYQP